MFGNMSAGRGNSTFANFNAKTGLFTIDHNAQSPDNAYREHTTTNGRLVYKEEHEAMLDVLARKVTIREETDYNDKSKKVPKLWVHVRGQEGRDAIVKFTIGQFAVKILGLLNNADLSQPLTLRGVMFAKGTKKVDRDTGAESVREDNEVFLVGYQGGEKLAAKFSDDPNFRIPKVDIIEAKNGKGEVIGRVSDPTSRDEWCLKFAQEVAAKVEAALKAQPNIAPEKPASDLSKVDDNDVLSPADLDMSADGGTSDAERFAT